MLRAIKSPYAIKPIKNGKLKMAKTFSESLRSFIETLPSQTQERIVKTDAQNLAATPMEQSLFVEEFKKIHKTSPKEGEAE